MNKKYKRFPFYRSYYENLKHYDEPARLKLYAAIIDFLCGGIDPNFDENSELYRVWLWIKNDLENSACDDETFIEIID